MKDKIMITRISVIMLLFCIVGKSNAQEGIDWSKVYADKYYFSYKYLDKLVILKARKDSMISFWINGVKDTMKFDRYHINSFECGDSYVGIYIDCDENYELYIDTRTGIYDGNDFQNEPNVEPNTFGGSPFYDCTNFKKNIYWDELEELQVLKLNNSAYYLDKIGCSDCAIEILEELLKVRPNRTVAYLNLGDAYWNKGEKEKAKESYKQYILLLKKDGKQNKIPDTLNEKLGTDTVNAILSSPTESTLEQSTESTKPKVMKGRILNCYYTNLKGDKIEKVYAGQSVYFIVTSVGMIGKTINLDFSDEDIVYEFAGKELENQMIKNFPVVADKMTLKLKALRKVSKDINNE
ncbi:tetratricopeptide repeat protein [Plebeiibacterium marinum]|uniref:Tetratricopeptide repeat protein n=1 Tax=Plebeiibacterium marinum TaxID=2992111 RepID=A0AAE3MG83_9BACT|nr:tetratricopeptide repeat protein [Plebeiobacterium marinum]MCW3807184.1 tetratricopeptide repeat protein [Plebeiobacterium marinum]